MITTVSLVGRTNVGKSSIFNKLAKSKSALVSELEGLTRDIKTATIKKDNKTINLIDTGGFYTSKEDNFEEMILAKAFEAIELSQIILFVVDKKFGISPYDKEIASIIRKSNKKVILVINKIDVKTIEGTSIFDEFSRLIYSKNIKEFKIGFKYLVFDPYKNYDDSPNVYSYRADKKFKWRSLLPAIAVMSGVNIDSKMNPYTANGINGISPYILCLLYTSPSPRDRG